MGISCTWVFPVVAFYTTVVQYHNEDIDTVHQILFKFLLRPWIGFWLVHIGYWLLSFIWNYYQNWSTGRFCWRCWFLSVSLEWKDVVTLPFVTVCMGSDSWMWGVKTSKETSEISLVVNGWDSTLRMQGAWILSLVRVPKIMHAGAQPESWRGGVLPGRHSLFLWTSSALSTYDLEFV